MKMKGFILTFVLSLVFVFGSGQLNIDANTSFEDVPTSFWGYSEINYLSDQEIITGYPNQTFQPNRSVSRAEAAIMIRRALDLETGDRPALGFNDIESDYFAYDDIAAVADEGIIQGNTRGEFLPNDPLTRGQMAAIIQRAFDLNAESDETVSFVDVDSSYLFYDEIQGIAYHNITRGYVSGSERSFRPENATTRAEFSTFLSRVLDDSFREEIEEITGELTIHYLDVGQADSTLIELPNGETILVDAGTAGAGSDIVAYLDNLNISTLDHVIATHPHADHIGGMVEVFDNFEIGTVYDSGALHDTQTYIGYLEYIDANDLSYSEPDVGEFFVSDDEYDLTAEFIHNGEDSSLSLNDASISFYLTFQEATFMFTGDAEVVGEQMIVDRGKAYQSDVLKAGHHGSNTSTNDFFIEEVMPEHVILSYGEGNSYGHPHSEVIDRLNAMGSNMYSTAEQGDIVLTTDGFEYNFNVDPWDPDVDAGNGDFEPTDPEVSFPIDINNADFETLQEITGVGPSIAQNIIDYRSTNGPFTSIEQIMNVSGIGEARFESMRDEITI